MQRFVKFLAVVGKAAGEQLIDNHAERINIAARIKFQRVSNNLLGTHVSERADELSDVGLHRRLGITIRRACDAKVENLRLAGFIHENVAGFEVPMNQAALVSMLYCVTNLRNDFEALS